jgi:adenylate cyclase
MAEERVQRRLAAILAADVVGYSRMMSRDEGGTLTRLKTLRHELFEPKTKEHGGRIFKTTGDGAFVEFKSAVDAVKSASDIQAALAARNDGIPEDQRILLRIGISLGDVIVEGSDLYGNGVNVASRMEGLAEPGGICISGNVHEHIGTSLDLHFEDLGDQAGKNIDRPIRCYSVHLERGGASAHLPPFSNKPAVAVLPFENLSGDPEQEYFADGLTEDIITALSLWRTFPVIARNSTFGYKGQSPDIRKVGEDLGARYILEGSVRNAGNRIRVTAQLINSETGHHVWAERYDRDIEDIFQLQDDITQHIAAIIEPELGKAERNRMSVRQPITLDAWDCLQRGMSFLYEFTADGNANAREMFEQAIKLDSSYSQAHSALALTYQRDLFMGYSASPDRSMSAFRQAARQAVALDEKDSFAHRMMGLLYGWERNFDLAIAHGEKAITLNPNDTIAHVQLGIALTYAGKPWEGIAHFEDALQLNPHDPRNFVYCTYLADAYLNASRFEDAVEAARTAIRQRTELIEPRLIRASALGHLGRVDEAKAELEQCQRLNAEFAEPSASWRGFRSSQNIDLIFDGLRKAGWEG